jgi:hypothetical protein
MSCIYVTVCQQWLPFTLPFVISNDCHLLYRLSSAVTATSMSVHRKRKKGRGCDKRLREDLPPWYSRQCPLVLQVTLDHKQGSACRSGLLGACSRGKKLGILAEFLVCRVALYLKDSGLYRAVNISRLSYEANHLILRRQITTVCSQIHENRTNTLCGQNV